MENPYAGRATISDTINGVEVCIPAKASPFVTAFIGIWLCGWGFGLVVAMGTIIGAIFGKVGFAGIFLIFWLGIWATIGTFILRVFIWNINGKEVVTIGRGELTIEKRGLWFYKPRTYDLNEARNFRVQDEDYYAGKPNVGVFRNTGTIRFDYGMCTIKFGISLDEAEAKYILLTLKERRVLSERNFAVS